MDKAIRKIERGVEKTEKSLKSLEKKDVKMDAKCERAEKMARDKKKKK